MSPWNMSPRSFEYNKEVLRNQCVLTDPFSMTLLSIITALEHCSQIISQKWPQVFLNGPCRSKVKKQTCEKNKIYIYNAMIKSSQNINVKSCTFCFRWSTDLFNEYLCRRWHLHCVYDTVPEKECKLFGLLPPWLNLHWCSHFRSFQVLPDCDRLKPDERP